MSIFGIISVFNEERNLPRCLNHLNKLVDGIVALDDGSTDRSLEILQSHKKVCEILRNKPSSRRVWNEGSNISRLNEALGKYKPDWVIKIDADETFEDNMFASLPLLTGVGADIKALAFRRHTFSESRLQCARHCLTQARMYRYSPTNRFFRRRHHISVIPVDVKTHQIRLTNIRLWHHVGVDLESCLRRYKKFVQTDPYCLYQSSYLNLLYPVEMVEATQPACELVFYPFARSLFAARHVILQEILLKGVMSMRYFFWPIRKRMIRQKLRRLDLPGISDL